MNTQRKPEWLKVKLAAGRQFREVRQLLDEKKLNTVCRSARCPNVGDCWSRRTATFMILGDICTRNCRFCAVAKGRPDKVDWREPERIAAAAGELGLRHVVITSVTRDDLPDGGAEIFARTVLRIRETLPGCTVEVLIPDFRGDLDALQTVLLASPTILNHNLEVVPRLYPVARAQADFERSLSILKHAKEQGFLTKTGIMVGLGESRQEILDLLKRLVKINLDFLTIGQYLQPTHRNSQVRKYYQPGEFAQLKEMGESLGIPHIESGPLVRSSYHADMFLEKALN